MEDKKRAYIYLLITFCAWGSLYVVSKFVLGKIPLFTISFLRYFIAGMTLLIILKTLPRKPIKREDYKYVFIIGFLGYFLAIGAQLLGTKLCNASLASLINSTNPILIMLFASIMLKEKLTLKKTFSIILAIMGTYIIIGGIQGEGQILGVIISIGSVILWSFVSVMVRRVTQKYEPLQITTYAIIIGMICTMPISIYEVVSKSFKFDLTAVVALLYMGLVCTALAHLLWNKSLSMIEAGICSLFYPLQPMIAVLLGILFLNETIDVNFIIGSVMIITGVVVSVLNQNASKTNTDMNE